MVNKIWLCLWTLAHSVSVWQNQGRYQQCVTTHRLADFTDGLWDVHHAPFQVHVILKRSKIFLYESEHQLLILIWQARVATSPICALLCLSFEYVFTYLSFCPIIILPYLHLDNLCMWLINKFHFKNSENPLTYSMDVCTYLFIKPKNRN